MFTPNQICQTPCCLSLYTNLWSFSLNSNFSTLTLTPIPASPSTLLLTFPPNLLLPQSLLFFPRVPQTQVQSLLPGWWCSCPSALNLHWRQFWHQHPKTTHHSNSLSTMNLKFLISFPLNWKFSRSLTSPECLALHTLGSNSKILILPADKGCTTINCPWQLQLPCWGQQTTIWFCHVPTSLSGSHCLLRPSPPYPLPHHCWHVFLRTCPPQH